MKFINKIGNIIKVNYKSVIELNPDIKSIKI